MEVKFDPTLDAMAFAIQSLFPSRNLLALRLLVDYKDPNGTDHNKDVLVTIPKSTSTESLIERVRAELAPGCILSAICSVDYMRPIYIAPGFIEESIEEQGKPIPDDLPAAIKAVGLALLTLDEIREATP